MAPCCRMLSRAGGPRRRVPFSRCPPLAVSRRRYLPFSPWLRKTPEPTDGPPRCLQTFSPVLDAACRGTGLRARPCAPPQLPTEHGDAYAQPPYCRCTIPCATFHHLPSTGLGPDVYTLLCSRHEHMDRYLFLPPTSHLLVPIRISAYLQAVGHKERDVAGPYQNTY